MFFLTVASINGKIHLLSSFHKRIGYEHMKEMYRRKGVEIGDNSILMNVKVSSSRAGDHFKVGKNCVLTSCVLLGHDASPSSFLPELGKNESVLKPRRTFKGIIEIGDNVFVGLNAIIMPGVHIGNNSIIGAGSVVTKNVRDDVVVAGNPAKEICSITKFIEKHRKRLQDHPEFYT